MVPSPVGDRSKVERMKVSCLLSIGVGDEVERIRKGERPKALARSSRQSVVWSCQSKLKDRYGPSLSIQYGPNNGVSFEHVVSKTSCMKPKHSRTTDGLLLL